MNLAGWAWEWKQSGISMYKLTKTILEHGALATWISIHKLEQCGRKWKYHKNQEMTATLITTVWPVSCVFPSIKLRYSCTQWYVHISFRCWQSSPVWPELSKSNVQCKKNHRCKHRNRGFSGFLWLASRSYEDLFCAFQSTTILANLSVKWPRFLLSIQQEFAHAAQQELTQNSFLPSAIFCVFEVDKVDHWRRLRPQTTLNYISL